MAIEEYLKFIGFISNSVDGHPIALVVMVVGGWVLVDVVVVVLVIPTHFSSPPHEIH